MFIQMKQANPYQLPKKKEWLTTRVSKRVKENVQRLAYTRGMKVSALVGQWIERGLSEAKDELRKEAAK